jgi:hypothetical protein
MSDFWIGLFLGLFVGLTGGYFTAKTAFNRAASTVAKYVLEGREKVPQMPLKRG